MANTINLITKYIPTLDEVYRKECKTAVLDGMFDTEWDSKCNEFKIAKMDMDGLSTYDKSTGYADADVSLDWESHKPNFNQGARLKIDAIDNEESAGLVVAKAVGQFEKHKVYPTLDAFRLSKYQSKASISKSEDLTTAKAVITALRTAQVAIEDAEADTTNCYVFITPALYNIIADMDTTASKAVLSDFAGVIKVPQKRLFTDGEFVAKKGFQPKEDTSLNMNFIIVDKTRILQDNKRLLTKVFTPEENQSGDDYLAPYHRYEIADVLDNGTDGIYASVSTTKTAPKAQA